jgi:hypothetical protein
VGILGSRRKRRTLEVTGWFGQWKLEIPRLENELMLSKGEWRKRRSGVGVATLTKKNSGKGV